MFEQVDGAAREVALEVLDVAYVGRAPGVDALIGVTDDGNVPVARGELAGEAVLNRVRVLELIDEDVLVGPAYFCAKGLEELRHRAESSKPAGRF